MYNIKVYGDVTSQQNKPQNECVDTHTYTHTYNATAAMAQPRTTKHKRMWSVLHQWVHGTD